MSSRLFACFIVSDEEASTARVSDDERAEYFRLSQEIREAEALQGFSSVSSQSLSVLVGNETFFQPSHNVNARLGNKEGSPCCTEEQTYAAGCGRRNVGGCWPAVPGRLCSQYPQRENNGRDVFDKKPPRNDQQGNRFSNQFTFFSKKLAFHSFSKIQVYFVMFLSPSGNVSVCVWVSVYSLPGCLSVFNFWLAVCLFVFLLVCM